MSDNNSDLPEYAIRTSPHARDIRSRLSPEMQLAVMKITDQLAENPDQFPHRQVELIRGGKLFVYTHPEPRIEVTYEIDRENKQLSFLHFAAPQFAESKLVFVSYSHKDKDWLDKLEEWLSGFKDDDRVRIWSDKQIEAGDKWRDEIAEALSSARVAVLLVSQSFLASKFIKENELPTLLNATDRGDLKVLWIAIRQSAYENTVIESYQAANDPDTPLDSLEPPEQDAKLKEIYTQIKAALEK